MARIKRTVSRTNTYHIMLRGNNKQLLFEDIDDYRYFINRLKHYKDVCGCQIYAYCLMDNHVHILIKSGPEGIGYFVKRLSNSYVYYFNNKYKRIGHLFQGRFKSEPVESEAYFLTVLRYIHQNPVKAGIVRKCEDYIFSSYKEYLGKPFITNTSLCSYLLSTKDFIEFHNGKSQDVCLEMRDSYNWRQSDNEALEIIKRLLSAKNLLISQLASLSKDIRNHYLRLFRKKGISINQLSRLTGISTAIITRASMT